MKISNKYKMNCWAYNQCKRGNDNSNMRFLIDNPYWIYMYCLYINDREDMWRKITDSEYAYKYCMNIKDRPEVREKIKLSRFIYNYCEHVKDDPEMVKKISRRCHMIKYIHFKFARNQIDESILNFIYNDKESKTTKNVKIPFNFKRSENEDNK